MHIQQTLILAGVKRIATGVHEETAVALKDWLKRILKDVLTMTEYTRRTTVTLSDVLLALKHNGRCGHDALHTRHDRSAHLECPRKHNDLGHSLCGYHFMRDLPSTRPQPCLCCDRTVYGFGNGFSLAGDERQRRTRKLRQPLKALPGGASPPGIAPAVKLDRCNEIRVHCLSP